MDPPNGSQQFQGRSSSSSYNNAWSQSMIHPTVRKMNGHFHQHDNTAERRTTARSGEIHGDTRVKRSLEREFFAATDRMENSPVRSLFLISLFDSAAAG